VRIGGVPVLVALVTQGGEPSNKEKEGDSKEEDERLEGNEGVG
jgi:hypothetical protein